MALARPSRGADLGNASGLDTWRLPAFKTANEEVPSLCQGQLRKEKTPSASWNIEQHNSLQVTCPCKLVRVGLLGGQTLLHVSGREGRRHGHKTSWENSGRGETTSAFTLNSLLVQTTDSRNDKKPAPTTERCLIVSTRWKT